MKFEYENMVLLKSPQNKVASNIAITEKKKSKWDTSYMPAAFWDKVTNFTVEPVVNCDAPAVKIFHYGDNCDCKYILMV